MKPKTDYPVSKFKQSVPCEMTSEDVELLAECNRRYEKHCKEVDEFLMRELASKPAPTEV